MCDGNDYNVINVDSEEEEELQQIDGGFFERFGSLLQQHSAHAEAKELLEKTEQAEAAAKVNNFGDGDSFLLLSDSESSTGTAGTGTTAPSTTTSTFESSSEEDVEEEGRRSDVDDYLDVVWNIDELYVELLYEILHNVGCDVNINDIGQSSELFLYLQDAFKMTSEKHAQLLRQAEEKEAPEILLNVEVIEAKDLKPKDSNGLSDPFVTLFLSSNAAHRYNTSVKAATLTPIWEEHFALPVSVDTSTENLCIEVWDFDPAESVREKFGKFFDVKGVKGVRKLVKEIAVAAATGQHDSELIGKARIPLNTIPASGMTMWYSLEKKNKTQRQGVIKVRLTFSSEKNCQVAAQEHRQLLKILLMHELEMSKVAPYWWSGTFSGRANALLTQHIAQSALQPIDVALAQWTVYATIHQQQHPLSFTLFATLIEKLIRPLQNNNKTQTLICGEEVKLFWEATKKLLPSVYNVIRKMRRKCSSGSNEKSAMKQLADALTILSKVAMLEPPDGSTDLFPPKLYPWLTRFNNEINDTNEFSEVKRWDLRHTLHEAVVAGCCEHFNHLVENNRTTDESDVAKLQFHIRIVQLVRSDVLKAVEFYDRLFQEIMRFAYAKTLYEIYQVKIAQICEPDILQLAKSLKKLSYVGYQPSKEASTEPLNVGTTLFELYLILQRFITLGVELCPNDYETMHIYNFHQWFYGAVAQWLDIAVFKALTRIEKAVDLDELRAIDATVKYSSSAVDTLTIFYQIKVFWLQLNWPDIEGCYTFIAKIIDDICRCCVYYADKMSLRVDALSGDQRTSDIYDTKFEVTREWCLAINNIDYVRQALRPFAEDLGKDAVIEQLAEIKSAVEAERCAQTLDTVILNAIDTVKNKIIELLETVVDKMCPSMRRLLVEGAELYQQDSNSIDRIMRYVDDNLAMMHSELNDDNFNKFLSIIWSKLTAILNDLMQSNLEKRRPPSFFQNLNETLNIMMKSFKTNEDPTQSSSTASCPELESIQRLLLLNGMETPELIHQVHLDMYTYQRTNCQFADSKFGELTVRVKFHISTDILHIEVMNARNLLAMDTNGTSDSFVRIHLLPEERFGGVSKPKTQTHHKNRFPLFEETFELVMSPEQQHTKDALILFSVKDYDLLGYNNQYIGEAFLPFADVTRTNEALATLPLIRLQLIRPHTLSTDAIRALESRQGDKLAKEFLKKLKQRMGTPATN